MRRTIAFTAGALLGLVFLPFEALLAVGLWIFGHPLDLSQVGFILRNLTDTSHIPR